MSIHTELGILLREARESKQMPVEKLAAESGLPARYVTALEEGRFDDLPDLAYARMYFFNCARALDMPADELRMRWPQSTSQTVVPLYQPASRRIPWKPMLGAAVVLLVVWIGWRWSSQDSEQPATASGQTTVSGQNADLSTGSGDPSSARLQVPLPDPIHELVLKATEKLWVVIEADGDTVVARVIDAGRMVEVEAKKEFVLTIGRPQAVLLVLNGRRVNLPIRDGRPVVRHRLIPEEMVNP